MAMITSFDVALLRRDMELRGWLQKDLARAANVSQPTFSRFLRNDGRSPRVAKKLADALGYSLERYMVRRQRVVA